MESKTPPGSPKQTAASWGMSLVEANGALYLGAGGSDYLAKYDKSSPDPGARGWRADTSGSVQVVELMEGQLVISGHFLEVADQVGDKCGHRTGGKQNLDPNDECQSRKGIAAYSFSGRLDSDWSPMYAGKFSLVWALHVDGASALPDRTVVDGYPLLYETTNLCASLERRRA